MISNFFSPFCLGGGGWPKKAPQGGEPGVTLMVSERALTQIPYLEITLPSEVIPITIIKLL